MPRNTGGVMDTMDKLDNEYKKSLLQKKEAIALMVRSLVRELKKTSEQSAANEKVSWALLSKLLERFVVSSRDYGYAKLSAHAQEFVSMKKHSAAVLDSWLKDFEGLMDEAIQRKKKKKDAA